MAQSSTSHVPPPRTSKKSQSNIDPDFEYDFVQRRIDQLGDSRIGDSRARSSCSFAVFSRFHSFKADDRVSCDLSGPSYSSGHFYRASQLAQLQRDKLALELEVLKLYAAAVETKVADGAETSKPGTARNKRTIDWLHEFCSGALTLDFEKLELADFVAGFLTMIKPYETTRKEVMLQLLE